MKREPGFSTLIFRPSDDAMYPMIVKAMPYMPSGWLGPAKRSCSRPIAQPVSTSADRIAPGDREENGDHEGQVNDRQKADAHRNENLDQHRDQRDEDDRGPTEFIDRDLIAGSETSPEWHDSAAHCGDGSPVGGVTGCCGLVFGVGSGAGWTCFGAGGVPSLFAGPLSVPFAGD